MAFDPIPLKQQVQVNAVEAKTFDSMWIMKLQINSPVPTGPTDPEFINREGSIYIEYRPMKAGTGELHSIPVEVKTEKLWLAVATVPEVAAAVTSLLAAIRPLEEFTSG